jgi:membrane protease YdiL (CAAX protease family)
MQISLLTPLYILAIYGLVTYLMRSKPDHPEENKIRWTPLESIGVTLFIYFGSQLLAGLVAYSAVSLLGWDHERIVDWLSKDTLGLFVLSLLFYSLSVGLLVLFLKRRSSSLRTIGFSRKPMLKDIGYAIVTTVPYFLIFVSIVFIAKSLVPALDIGQEQQIGFENVTTLQLPLVFIALVVLPPIVEEIMTRGFLYTGLKNSLSYVPTVLITSGLFAIAHLQIGSGKPLLWIAAIDTFVLSLMLIYLREKTGSLWAPIYLHAIKNGIAFMVLFVW